MIWQHCASNLTSLLIYERDVNHSNRERGRQIVSGPQRLYFKHVAPSYPGSLAVVNHIPAPVAFVGRDFAISPHLDLLLM